jgi:hypothetical protein
VSVIIRTEKPSSKALLSYDSRPDFDLFKFRRFRMNLIGFLKLPLGISETELREVIKACSVNLLATYDARARCAHSESSDTAKLPVLKIVRAS